MNEKQEVNSSESLESAKKSNRILGFVLKLLAILVILAVTACIAVYLWQKDNIDAVMHATKYTSDEIEEQIKQSKGNVNDALEKYDVKGIRDLTPEEEDELCRGNMSAEEAVALIMGGQAVDTAADGNGGGNVPDTAGSNSLQDEKTADASSYTDNTGDEQSDAENEQLNSVVAKYVAEMYALKAEFLGELGSLASSAKAQYDADKKTMGKAKAVENAVKNNLSAAAGLESECDACVEDVLGRFSAELEAMGADTSIIDVIRTEYQNEKSLKKSYYLSLKN